MDFTASQIGSRLRAARLEAGLTLRAAGEKAGTSHATIAAYEAGRKSPTLVTLLRILDVYGFAAEILLSPRVRERDGISRGRELEEVLALAEAFPARIGKTLAFPKFGAR